MEQDQPRGRTVRLILDGVSFEVLEGQSVAAALWSQGVRALRRSLARGELRGIYCNMGICFDCLVRIDGRSVRACMTMVGDGMVVESAE